MSPASASSHSQPLFDWPVAYEAEQRLRELCDAFLKRNRFARQLSERMRDETGTDFYEWIDYVTVSPDQGAELKAMGFEEETVDTPPESRIFWHPKAMMPRIVVRADGSTGGIPSVVAIRVESLADFIARHGSVSDIFGSYGSGFRDAIISSENGATLVAVERLGYRGFIRGKRAPGFLENVIVAKEAWRMRKRSFADSSEGIRRAFAIQAEVIECVGVDVACDLFFAEERAFWESRNRAARIQKRRQDTLGLGWANHDHHTFRCSRACFADVVEFFVRLGFSKRERYYAGAEAGWGAQIMEQPTAGIVVFADVDLMPEEVEIDFSTQRLPEANRLGTVGLWCALHGDSLLQAGMHHLEARFDFQRLRRQLAEEGIGTMKPFSDFPFLKQAFTEGQRWPVDQARAEKLVQKGLITKEMADSFVKTGAVGSHLENLQRKGGFKGFNQKSVSVIIEATDPRKLNAPVHS